MMQRKKIQTLALENLSFGYPQSHAIFENVSMELPKAKAVWIRSPGGRGKSTLLRLMMGLLNPQSGGVLINGQNISELSFEDFLPYRLSMGYSFDMGGLLNNKTLFDNLMLPLLYHKMITEQEACRRVEHAIDRFGLSAVKHLRPYAVTGSMRKLTCVIRAFLHEPQVIFLDDPLIGLKEENVNDLFVYLEESFASRGLQQMIFTSESSVLAEKFKATELLISVDWFTTRMAA